MNKRTLLIILAILIALTAGFILTDGFDFSGSEPISYTEFSKMLQNGEVESAVISGDKVRFAAGGKNYQTDNPGSADFKEKLLLAGVSVTTEDDARDTVTFALDMLFDAIFFGAVFFGISRLVSAYRNTFHVVRHTGVTFDKIAGMGQLKKEMTILTDILKNPKKYAQKGIRPIKGIIFEGPPGNGKTYFAKALAEEMDVKFIATRGAGFQSALMSMGAMKIRLLFRKARRNKPCIVFIDEFDSIGERRNYAGSGIDKENNRIITTMLNEMDGFTSSDGILIIAATNSYQSLDPALIRPGRFDLKYTIGNPDAATRRELVALYTHQKTLAEDADPETLVNAFEGLSCAAIEAVLNEASNISAMKGFDSISMDDIAAAAAKTDTKLKLKNKK